ncbi:DUF1285 domain-containing protein [Aureimonas ureilytica]|uniref:DUF1285 domain-containing protein n=1 Tax=Aureimonas ureilytica TaxID=401562 RepID=UPI0003A7AFBE|nr:DUF1285 domain-containing protein [Aureimonas ureilytica]
MSQADDSGLKALARRAERAGLQAPPVETWNPSHCGAIDIRIDRDGVWFHEGRPITREALVRLFATILRREADGSFVLVTPVEKLTIAVEDAPFLAVEMSATEREGVPRLTFRTNAGDLVEAGPEHPLRFVSDEGGFRPYLLVRGGLEARLTRALAFDLAGQLCERGGRLGIASGAAFFPLPDMEDHV